MEDNKEDEIKINFDWLKRKKKEDASGHSGEKTVVHPGKETPEDTARHSEEEISIEPIKKWVSEHKNLARNIAVFGLLALILVVAFNSRIQNIPHLEGKYLISPDDPYIFYRYSNYIAENGVIMQNDTMRYYPQGFETKSENLFPAYVAGYALKIGKTINPGLTMFDVGAWFAPVLLIIGLAVFFFLVKEIFNDDKISLIATGILAFSQAILFRTTAGFLEKEPLFMPLLFLTLFFFLKAYKTENKRFYIYGALSGLFSGLSGWSSGLFLFMYLAVVAFIATEVILSKFNKHKLFAYTLWFVFSSITLILLTVKYGRLDFYKSMQFQLPAVAFVMGLVSVFIKRPAKLKFIPKGVFDTLTAVVIVLAVGLVVLGPTAFGEKMGYFADKIQSPMGTDRFTLSVSENQPPVFYSSGGGSDWWHTFGLFFRNPFNGETVGIGVIFLLFFFGSIILFYKMFRHVRYAKYVTLIFMLFMSALIFEHFSNTPDTQWVSILFSQQLVYIGLFLGSMLALLIMGEKFEGVDSIHLFMLVWFVVSVFGSNGAVRLFFMLVLPSVILAAYCLKELSNVLAKFKWGQVTKWLPYALAFLIIASSAATAAAANANSWPGLSDWYTAMDWVAANTSENAVFTHWWDYGYIVQTMGERTTVVDPGNFNATRNYDVGGRLFNAFNMSEAYAYANAYQPTHWLINSEDVLKFYQIARLGSLYPGAEGRESYFSLYSSAKINYTSQTVSQYVVPNNIAKIDNYSNLIVFEAGTGQSQVLQDFRIGNKMYDGEKTYILRFVVPIKNESIGNPYVLIFDAKTQSSDILPVKCVCIEKVGCTDITANESVPTCIMFTRHYLPNAGIVNIPYKARNVLFTQLYLLDRNITGFTKVYDNEVPLDMNSMRGERTQIRIYSFDYAAMQANASSNGW